MRDDIKYVKEPQSGDSTQIKYVKEPQSGDSTQIKIDSAPGDIGISLGPRYLKDPPAPEPSKTRFGALLPVGMRPGGADPFMIEDPPATVQAPGLENADKGSLEGRKDDGGKARYDLVPWEALEQVVQVLNYGAEKYDDRNWEQGIKYGRLFAAALRHITAWWKGEDCADDSGLHHLAHAACCILFLLHYTMFKKDFDDRPNR